MSHNDSLAFAGMTMRVRLVRPSFHYCDLLSICWTTRRVRCDKLYNISTEVDSFLSVYGKLVAYNLLLLRCFASMLLILRRFFGTACCTTRCCQMVHLLLLEPGKRGTEPLRPRT